MGGREELRTSHPHLATALGSQTMLQEISPHPVWRNPSRCGECQEYTVLGRVDGVDRPVWVCPECAAFGGAHRKTTEPTSRAYGPENRALRSAATQAVKAWRDAHEDAQGWSKWRSQIEANRVARATGRFATARTGWLSPEKLAELARLFSGSPQ